MIDWKNLRPNLAPLKDPLEGLTQDQRFDIETISWARALSTEEQKLVQNEQGIVDAAKYEKQFKEAGISVDDLLVKYRSWQSDVEKRQKQVNQDLNGKRIRMPGYLLPLEFSEEGVRDFLLVPYVGASIHVPPPPANQFVMVNDRRHIGRIDVVGQFSRVVGVHDDAVLAIGECVDDIRLGEAPPFGHESCFGVRRAQKHGFSVTAGVVDEPFPDQGGAG